MKHIIPILMFIAPLVMFADTVGASAMYIERFNHFVNAARSSVVTLDTVPPTGDHLACVGEDGQPLFISEQVSWNPDSVLSAFSWIDRGITEFPDRLDMRFGKIYFAIMIHDFPVAGDEMISTLDHGRAIGYHWDWSDGPVDDGMAEMLDGIQGNMATIFNLPDHEWNCGAGVAYSLVARKEYELFPDEIWAVSNYGIALFVNEDYQAAAVLFQRALDLEPDNAVDASNLAYCYLKNGEMKKARSTYERALKMSSLTESLESDINTILDDLNSAD